MAIFANLKIKKVWSHNADIGSDKVGKQA
jgi:hypothetical protein